MWGNWKDIHPDFNEDYQREWWLGSFSYEEAKKWIELGFHPCNWSLVRDLRNRGMDFKQVKEWVEIDVVFSSNLFRLYYVKNWKDQGFTSQQAKEWISQNLFPHEHDFAFYLKQKGYTPQTAFQEKSKAQQWLDWQYPKNGTCIRENRTIGYVDTKNEAYNFGKTREQITVLDIQNINLHGSLKLEGFVNLERLFCWGNKLTNLDILLSDLSEEKLVLLDINQSSFSGDLTPLSRFKNLELLNMFINPSLNGSLKPLQELNKLKNLHIRGTGIDEDLEYLPDSIEHFQANSGEYDYVGFLQEWKKANPEKMDKIKVIQQEKQIKELKSQLEEEKQNNQKLYQKLQQTLTKLKKHIQETEEKLEISEQQAQILHQPFPSSSKPN